jgi:hypothetical protein
MIWGSITDRVVNLSLTILWDFISLIGILFLLARFRHAGTVSHVAL